MVNCVCVCALPSAYGKHAFLFCRVSIFCPWYAGGPHGSETKEYLPNKEQQLFAAPIRSPNPKKHRPRSQFLANRNTTFPSQQTEIASPTSTRRLHQEAMVPWTTKKQWCHGP